MQKGEATILRKIIGKRFGSMPSWADDRLNGLSPSELEELSVRVLGAGSIDELFNR